MDQQSTVGSSDAECRARPALTALTLQLLQAWTGARGAALFVWDASRGPQLLVSDGIDQGALDDARQLWREPPFELEQGAPCRGRASRDFLALPWAIAQEVRAIAYLEVEPGGVGACHAWHLRTLTEMMVLCLSRSGGPGGECGGTSVAAAHDDVLAAIETDNLVFLLDRHEWNIAHVARLLDVTRMTVYNRLRRAGIARKRVGKSPRGRGRDDAK